MRDIKFRAWGKEEKRMIIDAHLDEDEWQPSYSFENFMDEKYYVLMQYTGLKDKNGVEIYISDIGQFDNGDRFVLRMEDYLEFFIDWIGDTECEDQARDLYRISKAKIIGNVHSNPELLSDKQ